jgi:hypothetical protein
VALAQVKIARVRRNGERRFGEAKVMLVHDLRIRLDFPRSIAPNSGHDKWASPFVKDEGGRMKMTGFLLPHCGASHDRSAGAMFLPGIAGGKTIKRFT